MLHYEGENVVWVLPVMSWLNKTVKPWGQSSPQLDESLVLYCEVRYTNVVKMIPIWKQYWCEDVFYSMDRKAQTGGWPLLDASLMVTECSSRKMELTTGEENICCKGIYLVFKCSRWSDHWALALRIYWNGCLIMLHTSFPNCLILSGRMDKYFGSLRECQSY